MATTVHDAEDAALETDVFVENKQKENISNNNGVVIKVQKYRKCKIISITSLLLTLITFVILLAVYLNNHSNATNYKHPNPSNDLNDYVLSNTTVAVSKNSNKAIDGLFVVDKVRYKFASISNESTQYIEFVNIDETSATWLGFKLYHLNNSKLTIELIHTTADINIISISQNAELNANNKKLLESFLGNILCEHYVELSVKLGALGYLGTTSPPLQDLHRFALWIWRYAYYDEHINTSQWDDITDEFEKVNAIVRASTNAGYSITRMNELVLHSSNVQSINDDRAARSLLQAGHCGKPYSYCGNDCFGMCGPSCLDCWDWLCGNCDCWLGCVVHDGYCSCQGMTHVCCINVFWVDCAATFACDFEMHR